MIYTRRHTTGIILLFLLFFGYRFSFREDFRALEMLQIGLTTLADVVLVVSILLLIQRFRKIKLSIQKQYHRILTVITGGILYWVGVKVLIELHRYIYLITTGMTKQFEGIFNSLSYQVFDSYLVLAVGMMVYSSYLIYGQWMNQKNLTEQAEKERIQSELKYLRSQINPHFIFNILNNVHFLVDESNHKARKLIQDFSELLRYQLYETGSNMVPLEDEGDFLKKYMDVQKIRKEEDFKMSCLTNGIDGVKIAPLLLIIPLENAFKYSPSSAAGYVKVELTASDGVVTYRVENTINPEVKTEQNNGGLGIENLKKRLYLIYGEHASFNLQVDNHVANATLKIDTNNHEA